jgi:hypothetical protein
MFDAVVHIDIRKIEAPSAIRAVQDVRDVARHEDTKRLRKIVGRPDGCSELLESDIAPIALDDSLRTMHVRYYIFLPPSWDDGRTVIGHSIECGTRASAVAASRGDILGPDAAFTWFTFGCHVANLALERDKVREYESKVPGE